MRRNRGQSLMEYAVLTACVVAALLTMQFYVKRGIQGRVKQASEQIGEPYDAENIASTSVTTLTAGITSTSTFIPGDGYASYSSHVSQSINVDKSQHDDMGGS